MAVGAGKALVLGAAAVATAAGVAAFAMRPEAPDLVACEAATLEVLKSPTTYKRAEATRQEKSEFTRIYLQYDAANSFGTPRRGMAICEFPAGTTAATDYPQLVSLQVNGRTMMGPEIRFSSARSAPR